MGQAMYLKSLKIERFRAFRRSEIRLHYPGAAASERHRYPNVNVLLGNNGMGKSAALKAAAIALMSPIIGSTGYRPFLLVRREAGRISEPAVVEAHVALTDQDLDGGGRTVPKRPVLGARISRRRTTETCEPYPKAVGPVWDAMYEESSAAFFFVGYGVSRTVESPDKADSSLRRRSRHLRYQRVAGLFEEQTTLMPLVAWLPRLEDEQADRHREVVTLLKGLLPAGTDFRGLTPDGDYAFRHRGIDVPFGALSDGFRAYIGWIGDFLYHVCHCCPAGTRLVDFRGIVMIDEVDLHLHPEWQLLVLPTVSRALPRLQFVCTTHSPIVAGTVESANLFLVVPDGDSASVLARPEVEVHGLTADQILMSPHFGLESTRAPDFYEKLRQVSAAVSRGEPGAAARFMNMTSLGAAAADADDRPEKL